MATHLSQHLLCVAGLLKRLPVGVEYIVIADSMNPFTDFELVKRMTEKLRSSQEVFCHCGGAVSELKYEPCCQLELV
jgi:hypothetical protein